MTYHMLERYFSRRFSDLLKKMVKCKACRKHVQQALAL